MTQLKIYFCGPKGTGKTTAAQYLRCFYDASVYKLAAPLYQICHSLFGMQKKDRRLLQKVGDALRSVDSEVFLKAVTVQIEKNKYSPIVVVEDVRLKEEALYLEARGFRGIKIETPDSIRATRLLARDGEFLIDEHFTEEEAKNLTAQLSISNAGSKEELYEALRNAVELFDHSFVTL